MFVELAMRTFLCLIKIINMFIFSMMKRLSKKAIIRVELVFCIKNRLADSLIGPNIFVLFCKVKKSYQTTF